MEIQIIFIAVVALYGVLIGMLVSIYTFHRNIFTQRILSLNNELKSIENLKEFAPTKLPKLWLKVAFEEKYPPAIPSRNLQNPTYKSVVNQFNERVMRRDQNIRRLTVGFSILFGTAVLFWMINKLLGN